MKQEAIVDDIFADIVQELKDNLFPSRDKGIFGVLFKIRLTIICILDTDSSEKSDQYVNEQYDETPPIIRVSEISRKNQKRKERDLNLIKNYTEEIKASIIENPLDFLKSFGEPLKKDPLEYLVNLRFYGLQKIEDKTEYTMMQD